MSSSCRTATRRRRFLTAVFLGAGFLGAAAPVAPAAPADHLVISEIVVVARRDGSKFIEIVNPMGSAMMMDGVILTNGTNVSNGTGYWRIAESAPTTLTAGGGNAGTFHGKFPAGYELAAGDTIVIAVKGSGEYQSRYGQLPDFEIYEDGPVPDGVPELAEVFPGSINAGLGGGSNVVDLGENTGSVMLYWWDGAWGSGGSDLVADLDYFHWGTNNNFRVDKTGVTVGAGTYLDDTSATAQEALRVSDAAGDAFSFSRIGTDEGTEAAPGNGLTGHDETSEPLVSTWTVDEQTPPAPPLSYFPSAPIITGTTVLPAAPQDGQQTTVSVTAVTAGSISGLTVHYSIDGAEAPTVAGSDVGGGTWSAQIPAQSEGTEVTWWAEVTNSGGGVSLFPAGAPRFTEGWTTQAPPEPGTGPDKLLLTEVCTLGTSQEFVEIHNPNGWDVDLSDYYLTDAVYNTQGYWRIGAGNLSSETIGGGVFYDFQSRFPDGYTIAAGDTIVVSIAGSAAFEGSFEFPPDLELFEDDAFADTIPDMRWVFGDASDNSIVGGTTPSLTNGGEPVVLYYYEPGVDLTVDVDMFVWGGGGSYQVNKTGVTVGSSTYAPDTPAGSQRVFTDELEFGESYHRVAGEAGNQTPTGSNGIDGQDETSEDWLTTFAMQASDPSRPPGTEPPEPPIEVDENLVDLKVPAQTFLPMLGEIFPIRFTSRGNTEVKVRIFDQEGRHVITLFDSRFTDPNLPNRYTVVSWDGRDDRFELMKSGMYIVHLSVVDLESGDNESRTAPVVLATRLSK